MPSGMYLLTDLVASVLHPEQAADHCEYLGVLPFPISGACSCARARRGLGLTAQRGWALIGRMDNQVKRPEYPDAHEPAWGSTKASLQDDGAMDAYTPPPPQ
jgi:hypothetical protein